MSNKSSNLVSTKQLADCISSLKNDDRSRDQSIPSDDVTLVIRGDLLPRPGHKNPGKKEVNQQHSNAPLPRSVDRNERSEDAFVSIDISGTADGEHYVIEDGVVGSIVARGR